MQEIGDDRDGTVGVRDEVLRPGLRGLRLRDLLRRERGERARLQALRVRLRADDGFDHGARLPELRHRDVRDRGCVHAGRLRERAGVREDVRERIASASGAVLDDGVRDVRFRIRRVGGADGVVRIRRRERGFISVDDDGIVGDVDAREHGARGCWPRARARRRLEVRRGAKDAHTYRQQRWNTTNSSTLFYHDDHLLASTPVLARFEDAVEARAHASGLDEPFRDEERQLGRVRGHLDIISQNDVVFDVRAVDVNRPHARVPSERQRVASLVISVPDARRRRVVVINRLAIHVLHGHRVVRHDLPTGAVHRRGGPARRARAHARAAHVKKSLRGLVVAVAPARRRR